MGGAGLVVLGGPAGAEPVAQAFSFTGGQQTFVVPASVCQVTVDVFGAEGGGAGFPGSGFGPPGVVFETGVRSGDGLVTITYDPAVNTCGAAPAQAVIAAPRFTGGRASLAELTARVCARPPTLRRRPMHASSGRLGLRYVPKHH